MRPDGRTVGQTDGHRQTDMTKSIVAFRTFCERPLEVGWKIKEQEGRELLMRSLVSC